jgi:flavin-dependent dehydrogenase
MGVTAAGIQQGAAIRSEEFDAVIVGASLAGSTAAVKLGRAGARVALVEQRPDPGAYKQICSHFVQASAIPTLERLGLLQPALDAGAVRSGLRIWTRYGWIVAPRGRATPGLNLRRERLDPLLREAALNTPGVEARLGLTATALARDGERVSGVVVRDRAGSETLLRARLVVGADGRGSRIARLAGVATKTTPHGRFAYGGYFEGATLPHSPDAQLWLLDPQWAAGFPTDGGLTFYAAMPTKSWLPRFKRDPQAALIAFLRDLPEPPPIEQGRLVGEIKGKLEMPNVEHEPIAPGLALVGDAALATDPLWGIGCGWALQQAEWLGDAVGDALAAGPGEADALDSGLARYRRRWRRGLLSHQRVIADLANGRRANAGERFVYSAAVRDGRLAARMDAFGSRQISPERFLAGAVPRAAWVHLREARARRAARGAAAGAGREAVAA